MRGNSFTVESETFCHLVWQTFKLKRNQIPSFLGSPARSEVPGCLTDIAGVTPEGRVESHL